MSTLVDKNKKRLARKLRIRSKVTGTAEMPRVTVYRSNTSLYLQAINDIDQKTLCAVKSEGNYSLKTSSALGEKFGKLMQQQKVSKYTFDRNGYPFKGNIKAVVEGINNILNPEKVN